MITPVSAAYNFTLSGAGNYSIKPSSLFTYIDVNGTLKDLHATVEDVAEVTLSGNLIVSRALDRRDLTILDCTDMQTLGLRDALRGASRVLKGTIAFLTSMNKETLPFRWTTWFGYTDECRMEYVRRVYYSVGANLLKFTYQCSPCENYPYITHVCAYIFQSWDYCYPVTDRSLDQRLTRN